MWSFCAPFACLVVKDLVGCGFAVTFAPRSQDYDPDGRDTMGIRATSVLIVIVCGFLVFLGVPGTCSVLAAEYSLEDLCGLALERSERIRISDEDVRIAQELKEKAASVLWPEVSAFGGYTRYSENKMDDSGWVLQPDWAASWGLRLNRSFSLSGRELTALESAKGNIERSKYDSLALREDYLFGVCSGYYGVLRVKKAIEIAQANVDRLAKQRDAAAARVKVGEVTKTALLRAQAELSGATSEVVRAQNNLKSAKVMLARLVGLTGDFEVRESPGTPDAGHETRESAAASTQSGTAALGELKEMALAERPEVKAGLIRKKIAEEQVKYVRGAYWPTLSVEGVYANRDENPVSPFLNRDTVYGGVSLTFPFFDGGLRKAELREVEAKRRQAELAVEDVKKTVAVDVENAYLELLTQKEILQSLRDQLAFARDNYDAVSRQFEFGLADSLDVMDANTVLVTAERQLADAQYNYQLSFLLVKRATGTLLKAVSGAGSKEVHEPLAKRPLLPNLCVRLRF